MKPRAASSGRRGGRSLAAALTLLLLLAAPAAAAAQGLTLAASAVAVAPFGYTTHAGAGFAPSLSLRLNEHFGLGLTSGVVYYYEGDRTEKTIPVLLSGVYAFRPEESLRPYVALRAGYTYAIDADKSPHWVTVMAGLGVLIPTRGDVAVDIGCDLIIPDLRGNAGASPGLLFKIGLAYSTR
jgi:hypothetical protein